MKKAFLIAALFVISLVSYSQWKWLSPYPTGNKFSSACILNDNLGFMVGSNGTIIKITNVCTTFETLTSGTTQQLYSVWFTNADTGYVVGGDYGGSVAIKTYDGGNSWSPMSLGLNIIWRSVHFCDADTGYIAGANGTILKTTNAGATWVQLTTGVSWNIFTICFLDAKIGFAGGNSGNMLKTTDGGSTWVAIINIPNLDSSYFRDHLYVIFVYFTHADTGYAAGSFGTILKTVDGGSVWTQLTTGQISTLLCIHFTNSKTGYASGSAGIIMKTMDSGNTWNTQHIGTGNDLYSISFPKEGTGFVSGGKGTIMKTRDYGASWQMMQSNSSNTLYSIFAVDSNTVFAVGAAGTVLKTTNGGTTFINEGGSVNNNFTVYPNPAKDKIFIQGKRNINDDVLVRMFNLTGQEVLCKTFTSSLLIELNVSGYSPGLYIVVIQVQGKTESYKIIVE